MFIDDFTKELKRKGKIIILITIFSVSSGWYLGINSAEKWTSKAIVVSPTYNELLDLRETVSILSIFEGAIFENLNNKDIFNQFIINLDSLDNQMSYLKSIGIDIPRSDIEKKIRIVVTPDTEKVQISYTSYSAMSSRDELDGYVNYINDLTRKEIVSNVDGVASSIIKSYKTKMEVMSLEAKYKLDNKISELRLSSEITRMAGVDKPISDPGLSLELPISLGYEILSSQLQQYKSNSYNVFLDDSDVRSNLEVLRTIKGEDMKIKSYRYQEKPIVPDYKSSPSLSKNIIASTLFSMIFSVVILIYGIRRKNAEI